MLTQEQIKNLKPGDPVIIHGTFNKTYKDGDILIWHRRINGGMLSDSPAYVHPSCVSLPSEHGTSVPTPKYDPNRLFKEGDKVRVVECKGRRTGYDKKIYKVCEDEEESGRYIKLSLDGYIGHFTVDAAYIEIVIPVEELKPYNVVDAHTHWDVADKDMKTVVTYNKACHPNAKAAAEAECKRLNEEHRKNH